ncbi:hypothetical protein D3C87_1970550 [compost metagenome]
MVIHTQMVGGSAGKNIIFQKFNGSSYENYKTFATNTTGQKYELGTIEPGKYKVICSGRYVTFDEWVPEAIE